MSWMLFSIQKPKNTDLLVLYYFTSSSVLILWYYIYVLILYKQYIQDLWFESYGGRDIFSKWVNGE